MGLFDSSYGFAFLLYRKERGERREIDKKAAISAVRKSLSKPGENIVSRRR
jgi:hypothetical protein